MAIRADSTDTTIVPHRVMAELHPRDVLADLLGSGDFPVEIADPEAAAQLILDRLEGAGFVVIEKKSAYRGAHAYQAIETPVREVSKMAEIAMRLAIEVDCETEQFDLTLFTIGKRWSWPSGSTNNTTSGLYWLGLGRIRTASDRPSLGKESDSTAD